MIKVFIASERGHEKAEKALHYSIISNTNEGVEITWMKDEQSNIFAGWNKGRNHSLVNSGEGWKTNFSCYRWAIPELCNFNGRAIYLDVDQLVLADISEFWNLPMNDFAALAIKPERTDVMLMDCSKFSNEWWPKINWMKKSGKHQKYYRTLVQNHNLIGPLDPIYNSLDGCDMSKNTRLLHYTKMSTQPWHPAPDSMEYKKHKVPFLEEMWWGYYYRALDYEKKNNITLGL